MTGVGLDTVIRGGEVWVDGALAALDVGISGEVVAAISPNLNAAGADVIDANGLLVLPGGIDVHTHFHTEVGGSPTADLYESGTRAAAFGGITTILNYAFQEAGDDLTSVVAREQAKAGGQSYIDYGFHIIVTDISVPDLDDQLLQLPELGCPSIKVFTAMGFRLQDAELLRLLDLLRGTGILVNVHAEDGDLVDYLSDRLVAQGQTSVDRLGESRPPRTEALAVEKMVSYAGATGTPLYVVHLSSEAALNSVRRARLDGIEVYVETRPAYLYLDDALYSLPGSEGNKFACWPPLRTHSDQEALWAALESGEVQCYATDHTTWTLAQKMQPGLPFPQIPGGISNVQTSLGMLWSEGVQTGRLSVRRFVEVASETPAKLFGLWPRKGTLAVGSDADIMLLDPQRQYRVVASAMQSASDFDPYDGYESHGWPVCTMSRGQVVMRDERLAGDTGHGRFLHRDRFRSRIVRQ